jgi:hypothetical protein
MGWNKTKYSEIPYEELNYDNARQAMWALLNNGFVRVNAYNEIEVQRLVKALKDLNINHGIKYIKPHDKIKNAFGDYEFSTEFFIDDRK